MENQFNAGDLVWAQVHEYPWWPSIIYHEALTSTEVLETKKEGLLLVSFFGDDSYEWLDPKKLRPFESYYDVYSKRCSSQLFKKAVDEAVYEVNRRAAVGLTRPCSHFSHYRPLCAEGLIEVDIDGYKLSTLSTFTSHQIKSFRQQFSPIQTLSFVQQLALNSTDAPQDLNHSKEVARLLAFRKAIYSEIDEPYLQALRVARRSLGDPIVASNNQETTLFQAATGQLSEAESHGRNKVKHQSKNKRCIGLWDGKLQVAKRKRSVRRIRHHDSKSKSSENLVCKKNRQHKYEVEKKLDFSLIASPSKEPSLSIDNKRVASSMGAAKFDDVHLVEEVRSDTWLSKPKVKSSRPEKVQSSNSKIHSMLALTCQPFKKRQTVLAIQAPTNQHSEAENQGLKKAKVKLQNKNKRCIGPQDDKPHDSKTKLSLKINRHHDHKSKSSQDLVPQRKKQVEFKVKKILGFTSAASPSKELSLSKVKSSTVISKFDNVQLVEEVRSDTSLSKTKVKSSRPEKVHSGNSKIHSTFRDALACQLFKKRQRSLAIQAPTYQHSEAENQGLKKAKVKLQTRNKRCTGPEDDKPHDTEQSVKRNRHHDHKSRSFQDLVPKKKRVEFKDAKILDFTSAASPSKELSLSKVKSSTIVSKFDNAQLVKEVGSDTPLSKTKVKSSRPEEVQSGNSKIQSTLGDALPCPAIKKRQRFLVIQDPIAVSKDQETALIQAPTDQHSEAENQDLKRAKVIFQSKNKRCIRPQEIKPHDTKTNQSVKRSRHYDCKSKSSPDLVPKKKKRVEFKGEKILDFTSATSPSKEQSVSKVKSSTISSKCDNVHLVKETRSETLPLKLKIKSFNTPVSSKPKRVQSGNSTTHHMPKDIPVTSLPIKKRPISTLTTVNFQEMPLTSSPQKKRKGHSSTTSRKRRVGPKTILAMQFPPGSALPSGSELKARFVRFGPLDPSGVRVNFAKSRCTVVFLNKSDAKKAQMHAVNNKSILCQSDVRYSLFPEISSNIQQEEVPLIPPHAPVTSHSASACRIQHRYREVYSKYREQGDPARMQVDSGNDISEKMLHLLGECNQIVQELKPLL